MAASSAIKSVAHKNLLTAIFAGVFCGGFGILCIAWAVVTLGRGEYLTAVTVLGYAGLCFGMIGALIILKSGRVIASGAFDAVGTTIGPDRRTESLVMASMLAGTIGMGLFGVFWPLGKLDIPVPHSFRYSLPFMSAAGAVMGRPGLVAKVRSRRKQLPTSDPDGIRVSEKLNRL